jgi:hypothetical protein
MRRGGCIVVTAGALVLSCFHAIAQSPPPMAVVEGNDNPRANVHVSTPIVIPLNPTAQAVHLGFGFGIGGGYNFTRQHAAVGDFMWNNLFPTNEVLAQLRQASNEPTLDAKVGLYGLTGNYRYELRGKSLGAYFLGGGGLYYRHTSLSKQVTTTSGVTCSPLWLWWGFSCSQNTVTSGQSLGSWSTTAGGWNGGIGFTARIGEPPYRFYVESRYHYVPNSRLNTQLINISVGISY